MGKMIASSFEYSVLPVKVKNSIEPWLEILRDETNTRHCIVVDPVIGRDPLDITDHLPIFNVTDVKEPDQIYGGYIAEDVNEAFSEIRDKNSKPVIIKLSIACLNNSVTLKHVHSSTEIAMKAFLQDLSVIDHSILLPIIILNTKCDASVAPLNSFSEMIREITVSYLEFYGEYPTIFVAFTDDDTLTTNLPEPKKKKKKKK